MFCIVIRQGTDSSIPTPEQILDNILYYRMLALPLHFSFLGIHDYIEQIALINILPSILNEMVCPVLSN
jgi:hypothetical protein